MEMDGGYFHIRKDGIVATDRDLILLKCNNGCKDCKWRGQMRTTDRTMTMEQPRFFDPESYIMVNYEKACPHSPDCIQEIVPPRFTLSIYGGYHEMPQKACERCIFHVMAFS